MILLQYKHENSFIHRNTYLLNPTKLTLRNGKGKAVPLQAWAGPEGSRKLRFPDFMTTQDGGRVVRSTHWPPLPTGNRPGAHFLEVQCKGKAVPLQAWRGPGVSRKLRFPDFMTTQDGGRVVRITQWPPLPTGNRPGAHFLEVKVKQSH